MYYEMRCMKKEKSNFWRNVKKTWTFIKTSKGGLIGYTIISVVEAIISVILPLMSAKIILGITNELIEQLLLTAAVLLVINVLYAAIQYLKGFFFRMIYQKTLVDIQTAVAKETLKLEIKEIDKASSGVFIDRLNKDTTDISSLFMEYTYYGSYVISNIGVLFAILLLNKYLFIYAVITSLCIFMICKVRYSKQAKTSKELKKLQEKKTGLTGELVRGIRDIKVLNATDTILNQTVTKIKETATKEKEMMDESRKYYFYELFSKAIFDFMFLVLGCLLYKNALLTIPAFIIIYNYQGKVKNLLAGLTNILEYNKKFEVSSERIFEIIDGDAFEKEQFGDIDIKKLSGHIKFNNVEFGYGEERNNKIIDKMSFDIEPNQKVAFVGKSGAGKTTIFSLISRLYTIDKGEILIDGYNINDLTKDSLRNNISIITQNPYIFNFSIKENLLLAKENASMREIRKACKLACIDDYIMSLPDKYDTMVGENGIILSGGQKQRLAIARALLMKTEIILFDEATSALDNETQSEIQNAIDNLKGEYTILIVAHRLSTVIDCDKIFVVDSGKIIDSGKHKELLKKCKFYKSLYEKDLNT